MSEYPQLHKWTVEEAFGPDCLELKVGKVTYQVRKENGATITHAPDGGVHRFVGCTWQEIKDELLLEQQ